VAYGTGVEYGVGASAGSAVPCGGGTCRWACWEAVDDTVQLIRSAEETAATPPRQL